LYQPELKLSQVGPGLDRFESGKGHLVELGWVHIHLR